MKSLGNEWLVDNMKNKIKPDEKAVHKEYIKKKLNSYISKHWELIHFEEKIPKTGSTPDLVFKKGKTVLVVEVVYTSDQTTKEKNKKIEAHFKNRNFRNVKFKPEKAYKTVKEVKKLVRKIGERRILDDSNIYFDKHPKNWMNYVGLGRLGGQVYYIGVHKSDGKCRILYDDGYHGWCSANQISGKIYDV